MSAPPSSSASAAAAAAVLSQGQQHQQKQQQELHHHQHSALRGNSLLFVADYLASWSATTFSIVFSHPFDTARIRRQTHRVALVQEQRQHVFQPSTVDRYLTLDALKQRGRSVRSLYDGFLTPICTTGPCIAVGFALNELYQRSISYACFGDWDADVHKKAGEFRFHHFALAGSLAGGTSALVQTPVAVVRISQQVHNTQCQARPKYASSSSNKASSVPATSRASILNIIRKVYTEDGFRGFYRGLPLEAANASVSRLIYFSVWEEMRVAIPKMAEERRALREANLKISSSSSSSSSSSAATKKQQQKQRPPLWTQVVAAVLASWSGWIVIYPLDAIKSRVQSGVGSGKHGFAATPAPGGVLASAARSTMDAVSPNAAAESAAAAANNKSNKRSIFRVAVDVYRHHGLTKGLFAGLPMTLARGVVSSGISLPLYDYLKPKSRSLLVGDDAFE